MLWIFAVLPVCIGIWLFCIWPAPRRHPDRTVLTGAYIAHRGLHDASVPENSLPAFRLAADHGFAIETDIHITADGEVVVFHDDTLDRMCGEPGKPEEKTLAELKTLRLAGTDEAIPTLAECLAAVNGQVPLLIEYKCNTKAVCDRLCPAADKVLSDYRGIWLVQSFHPFVLRWYRKNHPSVCRGQLASAFPGGKLHMRLLGMLLFNCAARPDFISYEWKYRRKWNRRLCAKLGALPVGWTFRSPEEVQCTAKSFAGWIFEGFLPKQGE